jgi:hypothetical protein
MNAAHAAYPNTSYAPRTPNSPRYARLDTYGSRPHGYMGGYASRAAPFTPLYGLDPQTCGRVAATYGYAAVGFGVSMAAGAAAFSAGLPLFAAAHPVVFCLGNMVGAMATVLPTLTINPDNTVAKHAAWLSFSAMLGVSACGLGMLSGAVLLQAGLITAGVMGVTGALAALSSDVSFLRFGAPVLAGAIVLSSAALIYACIPALAGAAGGLTTAMYLSAGSCSLVMLYDTRRLLDRARVDACFDAVAQSVLIHLDALDVFLRVALALNNEQR